MQKFVFGYGSLVNARTHDYPVLIPARLRGWRRAWRRTPHRDVAFLTAVSAPGSAIFGTLAPVAEADWEALDARELAYDRHVLGSELTVLDGALPPGSEAVIYAIQPSDFQHPTAQNPVIQSYLDVVLNGYETVFGAQGIAHFVETTDGWDAPIFEDRATPRYPRSLEFSQDALARYDAILDGLDVTRI